MPKKSFGNHESKLKQALELVNNFAIKETKTVFSYIPKAVFVETLKQAIATRGDAVFQSQNTCGIASLVHLLANSDIVAFSRFAIELFQFGEATINQYQITNKNNVRSWAKSVQPNKQFDGVSLVVVGSIRFVENTRLSFQLGTMEGMTWPREIKKVGKRLLGVKEVKTIFIPQIRTRQRVAKCLQKNQKVIILYRTSAWKEKGLFFRDAWHYIVLKKIEKSPSNKIRLTYWDYGQRKIKDIPNFKFLLSLVSVFVFVENIE